MCWNRALLVHHTCSQCVPARRVRALRIARKHARGEILCRRLEWEQGAVSSRVASLLRSAEAKPMFYRFVRSSGPSPLHRPMEVCTIRPAPAARAQGARPGARAAARRRPPPPRAPAGRRLVPRRHKYTPLASTRTRARALGPPPQWRCVSYPLPATCPEYPPTAKCPECRPAPGPRRPHTTTLPLFYRPHARPTICGHRTMKTPYPVRSAKLSMVSSS